MVQINAWSLWSYRKFYSVLYFTMLLFFIIAIVLSGMFLTYRTFNRYFTVDDLLSRNYAKFTAYTDTNGTITSKTVIPASVLVGKGQKRTYADSGVKNVALVLEIYLKTIFDELEPIAGNADLLSKKYGLKYHIQAPQNTRQINGAQSAPITDSTVLFGDGSIVSVDPKGNSEFGYTPIDSNNPDKVLYLAGNSIITDAENTNTNASASSPSTKRIATIWIDGLEIWQDNVSV